MEAFASHAKTSASFDLGNSDDIQRGNRAGSAYASDATGLSTFSHLELYLACAFD
ncbi:MAG TPA: hypothetical protein VK620_21150 [Bradyrhizobium sp.]|nr:hypothetical protein [Bradyrhizobium sp.]